MSNEQQEPAPQAEEAQPPAQPTDQPPVEGLAPETAEGAPMAQPGLEGGQEGSQEGAQQMMPPDMEQQQQDPNMVDPNQMMSAEEYHQMQMQQMQMQQQMMDPAMQIDLSQMSPEQQAAYQQQLYEQQQQFAVSFIPLHPSQQQQQMMGYDPNQMIGPDGMQLTQEQYQAMLAQQQNDYGQEMGEYGHEMMGDPNQQQYMEEEKPEEDPIQDKIMSIIKICEENDALFGDTEFPANDQSLYNDPMNPPEYAMDMPMVEWKRPQEIAPEGEPKMYRDSMSPGDIKQGILGDCWFLGSLLIQSTNPELLSNLIVHDGIKHGFAVFQFFKNGKWRYVIVDTRIPFNSQTKTPLYGHCADANEFWVPLLEKAYAKLHGTYEMLNGGQMVESLVDLTGGVSEKFHLRAPEVSETIESGQFWKDMKKFHQQGFLIGCANTVKDENGNQEEGMGNSGILFNHAYGIQQIREVDGLQLIRIRNPWGQGEWTGKFADEDEAWDDHKGLKEKLNYVFKNDGNWWMRYDDFCSHFNKLYLCKIFPSAWSQFSIHGEWNGNTAGGPYPVDVNPEEENKNDNVQNDTNDRWFNNPQFRISVTKKTSIIFSLMQEDEKMSKRPYIPVNFLVVRVKSKRDRLWEINKSDIILEAAQGHQRFGQREITKNCVLYPEHEKKPVHYMIIPNTEDYPQNKKEEERPFFLRVFSSEMIDLVQLPNTIEQQFQGKWTQSTAGGRRVDEKGKENQFWCRNPQYFLNITKPTHLKIILKKKGGRRLKGVPIGLVVTKALSPTTPPATQIITGKQGGGNKMISSLPMNGMTYAESLRMNLKQEKKGENIPEFIPPRLMNMERKLQILAGEWFEESFFKNDDVAALYAFYQPTQGPFIIVPSMGKEDFTSDFTLTIFSSQPVEIQMLEDSRNAVISGKWTEKSAGGCHLYDKAFEQKIDKFTWVQNPKFHLKLDTQGQARVKITLSRPEKAWKKQIGMSLVGCMIGFYVYPANVEPSKDALLNREGLKFVPLNEISEEMILDGHQDGYMIMCTTYEPQKQGPFILSLSTDVDFSLNALE